MRTLELAETVAAGCGLAVAADRGVALASLVAGSLAGVVASCALDD